MFNFEKHELKNYSLNSFNQVIDIINYKYESNIHVLLSCKVVIYEDEFFIKELSNFERSAKPIGIIKTELNGINLKGFFRVPCLYPDIILFNTNKIKKIPYFSTPNLFYSERQISILIRKYIEENHQHSDLYFIGNCNIPSNNTLYSFHKKKLITNFPELGFYIKTFDTIELSNKEIDRDLHKAIYKEKRIKGFFWMIKTFLKSIFDGELRKRYDK